MGRWTRHHWGLRRIFRTPVRELPGQASVSAVSVFGRPLSAVPLNGYEPGSCEHDAYRLLSSRLHHPRTILRVDPGEIAFVNTDGQVKTAYILVEPMNAEKETYKVNLHVVDGLPAEPSDLVA